MRHIWGLSQVSRSGDALALGANFERVHEPLLARGVPTSGLNSIGFGGAQLTWQKAPECPRHL
jgi:hypothetical protein